MLKCLECINWKKTGIFAAGVAFGTAGINIYPAKMQRRYIQIVRLQCYGRRNV